jgi:hypothetical protein
VCGGRKRGWILCGLWLAVVAGAGSCGRKKAGSPPPRGSVVGADRTDARPAAGAQPRLPPRWVGLKPPEEGQALALGPDGAKIVAVDAARAAGLLVVDLGDGWTPFIFSESSDSSDPEIEARPNAYRKTFVDLANDRVDPQELFAAGGPTREVDMSPAAVEKRRREARARRAGKTIEPPPPRARRKRSEPVRNYLEVFGIPPTLSVLLRRIEREAQASCFSALDNGALRVFDGLVTYQNARQARRDYDEVPADRAFLEQRLVELAGPEPLPRPIGPILPAPPAVPWAQVGLTPPPPAVMERLRFSSKDLGRLARLVRGEVRVRAIRATQARLTCEGLLGGKSRHLSGMFDLPTHEALAQWERKNDIFGWGFLGEETQVWLQRRPLELHFETFKRILTERVADAAGIIEDGSVGGKNRPARYRGADGQPVAVPDTIAEHLQALLAALEIATPPDMVHFLRTFGTDGLRGLRVAFAAPKLPPYYATHMELDVEIDRGDVWYDFPFTDKGDPVEQKRERYPSLTLFTTWNGQHIPLARWRTTIGSWRSELHADGDVYYKYKSSDVGPRIWKQIVAAPVWVPPDSTPGQDLLTRKLFDLRAGPVDVVDTEVMGPGFQSAYGLVMAIHHKVLSSGGLFDNQIRTHGSVDYTSIARRFSHGCHRLVNTRAVRLFGFVLRHRAHQRHGNSPLGIQKVFSVGERRFGYELSTRGYYYELTPPLPVNVLEGRIVGTLKKPTTGFVRKPGVIYQAAETTPPFDP